MKRFFFVVNISIILLFAAVSAFGADAGSQNVTQVKYDTVKTTFADGSLARVYTVLAGTDVREGVAVSYHPNGKKAVEAPYKNGKLDGVFRSYYENGKLWQTIGYLEGVEEGVSTTYFENGSKKSKEVYRNGILNGTSEEYYENGNLRRKLPYVKGHIHGVGKVFDEQGAMIEEMTFEYGLRHGPYRRYKKGFVILDAVFEANRCVKNCNF